MCRASTCDSASARLMALALRLRVRNRVAVGLAAMIDGAAADDAVDVVAVSLRVGEPFQYDHADAFCRDVAVAALAEALAVAVAGDELPGAEHQIFIGMNADVDTAGNGQAGAPLFQILAGDMNRRQRGGAHGVQRHAGTMQIEDVRNAIGDAGQAAGNPHALPCMLASAPNNWYSLYITPTYTPTWPARSARPGLQARARVSRVFDRHPGMLQEQALLRIDIFRFVGRDVEKQRIEFIDAGDEAAPLAVMASAFVRSSLKYSRQSQRSFGTSTMQSLPSRRLRQ